MAKQLSCGVVFVNTIEKKILMIHPTYRKDFWDFPKGRMEEGETPIQAAIREVKEETSLNVTEDELIDFGFHKYNNHKNVHLFICYDKEINTHKLICTSMVEGKTHNYPEADDFRFFSIDEAIDLMCPSMKKVFIYELQDDIERKFRNQLIA